MVKLMHLIAHKMEMVVTVSKCIKWLSWPLRVLTLVNHIISALLRPFHHIRSSRSSLGGLKLSLTDAPSKDSKQERNWVWTSAPSNLILMPQTTFRFSTSMTLLSTTTSQMPLLISWSHQRNGLSLRIVVLGHVLVPRTQCSLSSEPSSLDPDQAMVQKTFRWFLTLQAFQNSFQIVNGKSRWIFGFASKRI